jgi:HSP20 family protein
VNLIKRDKNWKTAEKNAVSLQMTTLTAVSDNCSCRRPCPGCTFRQQLLFIIKTKEVCMSTGAIIKNGGALPSLFDDFFRPWNEWYDTPGWPKGALNMPAVNITEDAAGFMVSLAVPGMKKEDFAIDVQGNMLTISCNKEAEKEEKTVSFTRREYNYTSFSRSFTIPAEVSREKIDAVYENGLLSLRLPKKEESAKMQATTHIAVK